MPDLLAVGEAILDVIYPDSSCRTVRVAETPFFIGRGAAGNHLQIPDPRISRNCAAILSEGSCFFVEDRGHRLGIFVKGERIVKQALQEGDVITFGLENSYKIIFRLQTMTAVPAQDSSIENLLTRIGRIGPIESSPAGLGKLNLLLEATKLLHSQLPLDAVLEAMMDHAIAITNAERGLLLEADSSGSLRQRLARRAGSVSMSAEDFSPPRRPLFAWPWNANPGSLRKTFTSAMLRSKARRASSRNVFARLLRFRSTRCRARPPRNRLFT